jgi:2-dehydropantoate 2-reductase
MSLKMNIAVIGAGAMGAFYASKFFQMDRDCVSLVARGDRYSRLREKGLSVMNQTYHIPVIRCEDKGPPSDLIVVAVKEYHLEEAIRDLENRIGPHSIVLSVMNGIDSEERIGAAYGMEKLMYAVALGIDAVRVENRVTYTSEGKLIFGEAENNILTDRVKEVQNLFDEAGIVHETPPDMIQVLWRKFMINVGVNQVSAVLRAPYGVFQKSGEARELMEEAMREVIALAEKVPVSITEEDIKDWNSILFGLGPTGKTSMLQDVEAGRKTEVEMFAGKVMELGKTYGIPTPMNHTLFRLIKVIEQA